MTGGHVFDVPQFVLPGKVEEQENNGFKDRSFRLRRSVWSQIQIGDFLKRNEMS